MDKLNRFLANYQDKTPSQQKLTREYLVKNLQEAKEYRALVISDGWQRFSKSVKTNAENVGLGLITNPDKENALELIVRANEGINLVKSVEIKAERLEDLEEKFRNIK